MPPSGPLPAPLLAVLALLQLDARLEARLTAALVDAHDVRSTRDWDALVRSAHDGDIDACLLDPEFFDSAELGSRIGVLRERSTRLAILACVESGEPDRYFDLGGMGVDGIVVLASPNKTTRDDVDLALAVARARTVRTSLQGRFPTPLPEALAWSIEHAGTDVTVDQLAVALGLTANRLRRCLRQAGLPTPARLLVWGRLISAAARLSHDGRSAEEVAFSLGYSTAGALARAMKSNAGLTLAEASELTDALGVIETLFANHGISSQG